MEHPARGDADAYRRYFAGMDASMDQKAAFLSAHIAAEPGARILDLGCGSGALSARLAALAPHAEIVGIDIDPGTIAEAAAAHRLPNLRFEVSDASAEQASADAAVSCSLLHHIYTYSAQPYDDAAAEAALAAHVRSLQPGGILVLRDFCVDGAPDETCLLELPENEPAVADRLRDFAARARPLDPFGGGFPLEDLGSFGGWRRFRLHRSWSAEFLLRKDYVADWEAELREQYAFWRLPRFVEIAERAGARVLRAAPVHNPWVVANRFEGRARRLDERGNPLPWPATNMALVAERLAPGGVVRLREQRLDPAAPSYLRLTGWRHERDGADAPVHDLVGRPTGAVDYLPHAISEGRLRVLVRAAWPRPASVMMRRGGAAGEEIRSGHVVEMISLASDGEDPAGDFAARAGLNLPAGSTPEPLLHFLPTAGLIDEAVRAFAVPLPDLPDRLPAPVPPGMALAAGSLQSFDALGLLRAAEVGMLAEARLELAIRALLHRLGLSPGAWIGEPLAGGGPPDLPDDAPVDDAPAPGRPFVAAAPGGFLRRVRSVFQEVTLGPGGAAPGAMQILEMAVPSRHDAWTVSVLAVARRISADGTPELLVGLERRELPAAQLAFGDPAIACAPAWRIARLPDAADPLRAAAAAASSAPEAALTRLGASYYPSLGVTPERLQPFIVPAAALPPERLAALRFVPLRALIEGAARLRDGHLLVAAFRLKAAMGAGTA